jgi:hypothetical protein
MTQFGDGSVRLGYNHKPWTFSSDPSDAFTLDVDRVRRPVKSPREELTRVLSEIQRKYGGDLHILYSGGYDSEAILDTCRVWNIPHRAIILQDTNLLNYVEMHHAKNYITKTGMTNYDVIRLDFNEMTAKTQALAEECENAYPIVFLYADVWLNGDRRIVLGGDEPYLRRVDGAWHVAENEQAYAVFKMFDRHGVSGIPSPWYWDTEIYNSWIFAWVKVLVDLSYDRTYFDAQTTNSYTPIELTTNVDDTLKTEFMRRYFPTIERRKKHRFGPLLKPYAKPNLVNRRVFSYPLTKWIPEHI